MRLPSLRELHGQVLALYYAARDPRTPWYAKLLVGAVAAYALSPIDLIPDFIPIVGLLDDAVLLPLGLLMAVRLVPAPVLAECRQKADERVAQGRPVSRAAAITIIAIWIAALAWAIHWGYGYWAAGQ